MGCMAKLCKKIVSGVRLVEPSKSALKEMESVLSVYIPESEVSLLSGLFDIKLDSGVLEELETWDDTDGFVSFRGSSVGDLLLACTNVQEKAEVKYSNCLLSCQDYLMYAMKNSVPVYELYTRCAKLVGFIVSLYHTVDRDYSMVDLKDLYLSPRAVMLFDRYGFRALSDICERYYEDVVHILGNDNEDIVRLENYCKMCRVERSMDLVVDLRFEGAKPVKVYSDRLLENSKQFLAKKPIDDSDMDIDCLELSDDAKRELHTNGIHTISEFFDRGNMGYSCCLSSRVWLEISNMMGFSSSCKLAGRKALNCIFRVSRKPITSLVGLMDGDWELDVCKCDFIARSVLDKKHYRLYRDMVYGEKKSLPTSYAVTKSNLEYASSTVKLASEVTKQLDLQYTPEFIASIECGDVAVNRYTYADRVGINKVVLKHLHTVLGRPVVLGDLLEHGRFVVERGMFPRKTYNKVVKQLQDLGVDTSEM